LPCARRNYPLRGKTASPECGLRGFQSQNRHAAQTYGHQGTISRPVRCSCVMQCIRRSCRITLAWAPLNPLIFALPCIRGRKGRKAVAFTMACLFTAQYLFLITGAALHKGLS